MIRAANAAQVCLIGRWGDGVQHPAPYALSGDLLALASGAGVYLYRTASLQKPKRLLPVTAGLLAFSPSQRWLAIPDSAHNVVLWTVSSGKPGGVLPGVGDWIAAIQFSPKSTLAGAVTQHGSAIVWSIKEAVQRLTCPAQALTFLSESQIAAVLDQTLTLRDVRRGTVLRETLLDGYALDFSPDGRRLVTVSESGVGLWDVAAGERLTTLSMADDDVQEVVFSADGQRLALIGSTLTVLDLPLGEPLFTGENLTDWNHSVEPAQRIERRQGVWERSPGERGLSPLRLCGDQILIYRETPLSLQAFTPRALAALEGGNVVALVNGELQALNSAGEVIQRMPAAQANCMTLSANGRMLVVHSQDGVHLCSPQTFDQRWSIPLSGPLHGLAISPDGSVLALNGDLLRVWDTASGRLMHTLCKGAAGAAFSSDGRLIAVLMPERRSTMLLLWDTVTGALVERVPLTNVQMEHLAFAPDAPRLVAWNRAGTLLWYDRETRCVHTVIETDSRLLDLAFCGDLLVTLHPGWLVLWDLHGTQLQSLPAHSGMSGSLSVAPDGSRVVTCGGDGTIRLWGLPAAKR